jgi:hypothetical protein
MITLIRGFIISFVFIRFISREKRERGRRKSREFSPKQQGELKRAIASFEHTHTRAREREIDTHKEREKKSDDARARSSASSSYGAVAARRRLFVAPFAPQRGVFFSFVFVFFDGAVRRLSVRVKSERVRDGGDEYFFFRRR